MGPLRTPDERLIGQKSSVGNRKKPARRDQSGHCEYEKKEPSNASSSLAHHDLGDQQGVKAPVVGSPIAPIPGCADRRRLNHNQIPGSLPGQTPSPCDTLQNTYRTIDAYPLATS